MLHKRHYLKKKERKKKQVMGWKTYSEYIYQIGELYQCSPLYQQTQPTYQQVSTSPAEHQATTSSKTPGLYNQRPRNPAQPTSTLSLVSGTSWAPNYQQANTTFSPLASYPSIQPHSLVGQHQL